MINKYSGLENLEINKLIAKLEFKKKLKEKNKYEIRKSYHSADSVILIDKINNSYSNEREYCYNNDRIIYNLLINNKLSFNLSNPIGIKETYYTASVIANNKLIEATSIFYNRAILECILLLSEEREIIF